MGGGESKIERELKEQNAKLQEENEKLKKEQERQNAEQQKLREEQDRLKQEQQRLRDEQQRSHDEQLKLKNENRDLELQSAKAVAAEREAELRRVNEELELNKRNQKMLDDLRESQEKTRILEEQMRQEREKARVREEEIRMDNLARQLEANANAKIQEAAWMQQEAERILAEGKEPIKYPTGKEIAEKRASLEYQEGLLHIAITGCSGSGKSSLVNAVRGYEDPMISFLRVLQDVINPGSDSHLAQVGTSETTMEIRRYPDPHRRGLVWYDVPGAGTTRVPNWQYFNNQGLYVFDAIMIVVGDRVTRTDVNLLFHCERFGIPTFFVQSKADQNIRNSMRAGYDEDTVRTGYISSTRAAFNSILTDAGMPLQKVYIISRETLRLLMSGSKKLKQKSIIDEKELIRDITTTLQKWLTPVTMDESTAVGHE